MKFIIATHESIANTRVASAMLENIFLLAKKVSGDVKLISRDYFEVGGVRSILIRRSSKKTGLVYYIKNLFLNCIMLSSNDVVYSRSYPSMVVLVCLKMFLFRRFKIIFDTRGLFFDELVDLEYRFSSQLLPIMLFFEKIMLRCSDLIICVSKSQLEVYENRLNKSLSSAIVIPNMVKAVELSKNLIDDRILRICSVGSLSKWHCPEAMREIILELESRGVPVEFHVITTRIDYALSYYSSIANLQVYEWDFRSRPIRFDFGFCLIKTSLSKKICFPVKLAEYLQAGIKIIYSTNVDVHVDFLSAGPNVPINIDDLNVSLIVDKLLDSWATREKLFTSLPSELNSDSSNSIKALEDALRTL